MKLYILNIVIFELSESFYKKNSIVDLVDKNFWAFILKKMDVEKLNFF